MAALRWGWGWDPWREFRDLLAGDGGARRPAANVYESGDAYGLEFEVPGVAPEDLELTVEGDTVTLGGTRKSEGDGGTYHRRERPTGRFGRSIRLPSRLDAGKTEAHYADGVLLVRVVKAAEARARKIAVKAG